VLCGVSAYVNMEIAPRCRVAYNELRFRVSVRLGAAMLPERTYIRDFEGYIFYLGKNRNNQLEDILIYELNGTSILRAPRGEIHVDAAKREVIVERFVVKGI